MQHYKKKRIISLSNFENVILCSSGVKDSLTKALTKVLGKKKEERKEKEKEGGKSEEGED